MAVDLKVPQIGESVATVFIAEWLKKPGDAVEEGEDVVLVDSDKASMEVPAPVAGVLTETLVEEGDEVDVGAVLGRIEEGATAEGSKDEDDAEGSKDDRAEGSKDEGDGTDEDQAESEEGEPSEGGSDEDREGSVKAGPAARRQARGSGVDLDRVQGTGRGGRVTSDDVRQASSARGRSDGQASKPSPAPAEQDLAARTERVKMTPLRRTIARRLLEAKQSTAMLTTFNEADMTAVMALRKRYQERFVARYGIKVGFMSFFLKAAIEALKQYPAANAEIDGNEIVYKNFYNIGVAVSTERGLVVPVIKDADRLSFAETELAIAELAGKARDGKLTRDDFADGPFTISNGGIFGSLMSTPILNPPQVAILGMHTIQKRPVAIDDQVVIRPMMYLALSYDHRIIDGREAVSVLIRIKELIEDPERLLLEV